MPSEIFAFVQAQPNIQTQTLQTISNTQGDIQPGLFDAFMSQFIPEENIMQEIPEEPSMTLPVNFTSNNAFSPAMMIEPEAEAEAMPEIIEPEEEEIMIWDEVLPEEPKTSAKPMKVIPEAKIDDNDNMMDIDMKPDTPELAPESHHENIPDTKDIPEHPEAPELTAKLEQPKAPEVPAKPEITDTDSDTEEPEDTDKPEDAEPSPEAPDDTAIFTASQALTPEVITPAQPQPKPQTQPQAPAVHQVRQPQKHDTEPEARSAQEADTPEEPRTDFRRTLETELGHENADTHQEQDTGHQHDTDSDSGHQDFTQSNARSRTSRPDSRRTNTEASSQPERTSTTHRTNNFQAFFQGAITSRRVSAAQNISEPMNIRESYNFTQAQTLRNGIVNVVRFIRADGVQRARVIVDPPALGRISVELTSGTSGVEASIKVSSEQIRQLVQDQLSELRMNLSRQGVQVAEFTVDVQQDNSQGQNSGQQDQERRQVNIFDRSNDDEPEEFRVDLEDGLLYWVA